ncbi:MAG: histidine phosphatase family protein [Verrucomicrobia bacterium]|nr:histidine phosphatase family protein [Kiritimatiellia bacterium]MCO6400606.1 histidine phosphatase family protein [Verrucomicrobiota bacterium]
MRILFIRHAEAAEAEGFDGPDIARPLTKKGKKLFLGVARGVARAYPGLDRIISSEAVRARQTAEILAKACGSICVELCPALNPGASEEAIVRVICTLAADACVALVGHEPDFSTAISSRVAGGALRLKLKKGGFADVEIPASGEAVLRALVDPKRVGFPGRAATR